MLGGARYSCCYRKQIKRGCQAKWECCQGDPGGIGCRTRYTCCKNDIAVEGSDIGCQKRYSCCRGRMEDEGCTQVKSFISLHDKNTEEFKICERGGGGLDWTRLKLTKIIGGKRSRVVFLPLSLKRPLKSCGLFQTLTCRRSLCIRRHTETLLLQ